MEQYRLEESQLTSFCEYLREEEKSPGTVEKYARDVRAFFDWLKRRPVTKKVAFQWKEYLPKVKARRRRIPASNRRL